MGEYDYDPSGDRPRIMPQNMAAEKAVLAAMILSPETIEEILSMELKSEVFYRPAHQKIFTCITELYMDNVPVDQISISDHLGAKKQLDECGGDAYIIELGNNSLSLVNWKHHLEIVKRTALLRDLIHAATEIVDKSFDAPDDLDILVDEAESLILNVTDRQVGEKFVAIGDLAHSEYMRLQKLSEEDNRSQGVQTGFDELDAKLAGFRGGNLVVLAARPGMGKTALALNIGMNAARLGTKVVVFSLEMSAQELMPRVFASEGHISLTRMRDANKLTIGDFTVMDRVGNDIKDFSLYVDDTPAMSIVALKSKARRLLHDSRGNGLIILDYLQLMQPQGRKRENRQVEIAEISRGLKIIAKEMDVPVLALSQLSRAVETRPQHRPMLSDLRESGAIEQDADIVMFLDRTDDGDQGEGHPVVVKGKTNLIIAKNRNGSIGDIPLHFCEENTRFSNDPDHDDVYGH